MPPNHMGISTKKSLFLLACLLVFVSEQPAAQQLKVESHRVFVVHSYNEEYIWTKHINEGVGEGLRGLGVSYEYAYLDAKRKPAPESLRQTAEIILKQIETADPDVVIAVDDPAQTYLVEPYLKGKKRPQVIFCGVNAPINRYGYPSSNVSGVRERWHWRDSFLLLKTLSPKIQSMAVLMDNSESASYVIENLRDDLINNGHYPIEIVEIEQVKTYQQWQERVLFYESKVDALALGLYHSLVDQDTGVVVSPDKISEWNNAKVHKPTVGFTDFALEHGHLAGVLESGHEQGYLAGVMTKEVLENRVPAGSLPVRINQKGIVFVNLKTAEKLNIIIPYEIFEAAGAVVR